MSQPRNSNGRMLPDPELLLRDQKAWELRVAHLTYRQIGEQLGVSTQTAYRAVENHARRIPTEDDIAAKRLMLAELDMAARRVLEVMDRDDGPILAAVDRLIRLQERRCRMMGLDAPKQEVVTVITQDAVEAEIARLEKLLALDDYDGEREAA